MTVTKPKSDASAPSTAAPEVLVQAPTPDHVASPELTADRLGLLIEAVEEYAIFMLDPSGKVVTWNPGARRIKGYAADEIVGQHFSVFYADEEVAAGKPQRELDRAIADGMIRDEGSRVRKDGSPFLGQRGDHRGLRPQRST